MKLTIQDIKGLIEMEVGKMTDLSTVKAGDRVNMILVNPITKEEEIIVVDIVEPSEQNQAKPEKPALGEKNAPRIIEGNGGQGKSTIPAKKSFKKIIVVVNVEPMPDE